jgi:hypothetical protein
LGRKTSLFLGTLTASCVAGIGNDLSGMLMVIRCARTLDVAKRVAVEESSWKLRYGSSSYLYHSLFKKWTHFMGTTEAVNKVKNHAWEAQPAKKKERRQNVSGNAVKIQ